MNADFGIAAENQSITALGITDPAESSLGALGGLKLRKAQPTQQLKDVSM
jgi:hypothetical protein